jgi:hypothetical protein
LGGIYRLHHQGEENQRARNNVIFLRSALQLLITADVLPKSPIFSTLKKEAKNSSDTSVLTEATWRHIPEDGILQVVDKSEILNGDDCNSS